METISIPLEIRALQHAASKDATRFNLAGVYCNCNLAVATDGHIMAISKIAAAKAELPKNTILKFSTKKPGKIARSSGYVMANEFAGGYTDPLEGERIEKIEGEFPDFKRALPSDMEGSVTVSFDAKLLAQLAAALPGDTDAARVTLQFVPGQLGPILVRGNRETSIGVIMPLRCEGDSTPLEVMKKVME